MNHYNVIQNYLKVRDKYMHPELIQNAFCKTGLYLINLNIFTAQDYVPSQVSSTIAHIPPSYPFDIPSSDPAISSNINSDYEPSDNSESDEMI